MQRHSTLIVQLFVVLLANTLAHGAEGDPIAIRNWPDGTVSIETHWGLRLAIVTADDHANTLPFEVDKTVSTTGELNHVLSRKPNQASSTWSVIDGVDMPDPNKLIVRSGGELDDTYLSVEVDGVRVAVASKDTLFGKENEIDSKSRLDLLALSGFDRNDFREDRVVSSLRSLRPRYIVIGSIPGEKASEWLPTFIADIGAREDSVHQTHNTFAIAASDENNAATQVVLLGTAPWKMPAELETLFVAMEKSCRESQRVFTPLSPRQLNFKPSNGTHTPRWNVEHMMGRQLLFFSQIYNVVDPTIPVMDLNPEQMPPDYIAAHPDWDGEEEARQMERVSNYCRRFAYLLDGLDVDAKAPGSRWPSLRALLNQMQRHYTEHTANTVKKFDLPDWPAE